LLNPALWEGAQPTQANSVSVRQELREFKKIMRQYCQKSTLAILATLLPYTPPILKILGCKGVGIIFFGPESPGDILGPIAASVLGPYDSVRLPWQDGVKFRGRSSRRADIIERHLRLNADGFVVVDRNSLRGSQRNAGQLLHQLATDAAEGFSDGNSGERSPFVFMGETTYSPEALLSAASLELDPTRLIGIPASAPPGCWPFHDLHGFSSASRLGTHLAQILSSLSGAPMSQYWDRLTNLFQNDLPGLIKYLDDNVIDYEQNYRDFSVEAVDKRRIEIFPIIYAAGVLANYCGASIFTVEEIREAVKDCENACFYHYTDVKGTSDLVKLVAQFIDSHYRLEFVEIPAAEPFDFRQELGFYTRDSDGFINELQVPTPRFRKLCAPNGWKPTLGALDEAGLLIRDCGSFQSKCQLWPGDTGRHYMYRFKATILEHLYLSE
jgi:hypothetical protein